MGEACQRHARAEACSVYSTGVPKNRNDLYLRNHRYEIHSVEIELEHFSIVDCSPLQIRPFVLKGA
jgi:hypothetical protein